MRDRILERLRSADCPAMVLIDHSALFPEAVLESPTLPLLAIEDPGAWLTVVSRARFALAAERLRREHHLDGDRVLRRFRAYVAEYARRLPPGSARDGLFYLVGQSPGMTETVPFYSFAGVVYRLAEEGGARHPALARAEALEGLLAYVRYRAEGEE